MLFHFLIKNRCITEYTFWLLWWLPVSWLLLLLLRRDWESNLFQQFLLALFIPLSFFFLSTLRLNSFKFYYLVTSTLKIFLCVCVACEGIVLNIIWKNFFGILVLCKNNFRLSFLWAFSIVMIVWVSTQLWQYSHEEQNSIFL